MHGLPLLQGGAQGSMQAVFEIELTAPRHDVGEQVAVERGVFLEQGFQIEGALGGDELVEAHLVWGDGRPLLLYVPVVRVGTYIANALEDHAPNPRRPSRGDLLTTRLRFISIGGRDGAAAYTERHC